MDSVSPKAEPSFAAWAAVHAIRSDPKKARAVMAACQITKQALWQWTRVPLERVFVVAKALHVAPHRLRPDFFQPPRPRKPKQPQD